MAKRKIVLVGMKLEVNQNTEFISYSWHIAGLSRIRLGIPLWEVLSMGSEQCRVLVVKLQGQPLAVHFWEHIIGVVV